MKELEDMVREGPVHWLSTLVVALFMIFLIIALYILKSIDTALKTLDEETSKGVERLFHRTTPRGVFHIILGSIMIVTFVVLLVGFSFNAAYSGLAIMAGFLIAIRGTSLSLLLPVQS